MTMSYGGGGGGYGGSRDRGYGTSNGYSGGYVLFCPFEALLRGR